MTIHCSVEARIELFADKIQPICGAYIQTTTIAKDQEDLLTLLNQYKIQNTIIVNESNQAEYLKKLQDGTHLINPDQIWILSGFQNNKDYIVMRDIYLTLLLSKNTSVFVLSQEPIKVFYSYTLIYQPDNHLAYLSAAKALFALNVDKDENEFDFVPTDTFDDAEEGIVVIRRGLTQQNVGGSENYNAAATGVLATVSWALRTVNPWSSAAPTPVITPSSGADASSSRKPGTP